MFSCELCKSFKRATFLQKTPTKLFLHIKRVLNCYQSVEHGKYIKMFGERLPLNVFEQLFKGKMADDQCLKSFMGGARWLLKKKRSHLPKLKARIFWQVKGKMDFQKCRVTLNINQKYSWWPNSNSYFKKYILQNIKLKHAFLKLLFLWPRWLNHLSSCIFYFIASYLIRYEKGNTYCKEGK